MKISRVPLSVAEQKSDEKGRSDQRAAKSDNFVDNPLLRLVLSVWFLVRFGLGVSRDNKRANNHSDYGSDKYCQNYKEEY